MFMQREILHCQRGKAPENVADLKVINQIFVSMGNNTGKIYVDITGRYDTVVWEIALESLDQFFSLERGIYVDRDEDTGRLIDRLNANTVAGYRELYEVMV